MKKIGNMIEAIAKAIPLMQWIYSRFAKKSKIKGINKHSFFLFVKSKKVDFKTEDFVPEDAGKTEVFRDIFIMLLNAFDKHYREGVIKIVEQKSPENLDLYFIDLINETMDTFQTNMVRGDIPDIVIKKFNEWHHPSFEFLRDQMKSYVMHDDAFMNEYNRIYTMLVLANFYIIDVFRGIGETIKAINGHLAGLPPYKGKYEFKKYETKS